MGGRRVRMFHISDLHMRSVAGPQAKRARVEAASRWRVMGERWADNLAELRRDGVPFDLVVFTGDLGDWGHPTDYDPQGIAFLKQTCATLAVPLDRLFVIPGNHDIDRKAQSVAWRWVRNHIGSDPRAFSEWMAGLEPRALRRNARRDQILERQQALWAAVATKLGRPELEPRHSPHGRLGYRQAITLPGLSQPIQVIGLDSAWLAGDDHDGGALRLTEHQVSLLTTATDGAPLPGFRLALMHHRLADLADETDTRRLMADRVDLLLHGHQHEPAANVLQGPDHQLLVLATGCLYEGDAGHSYPNACQVIDLELDEQAQPRGAQVRFRGWSALGMFWGDDALLYRSAHSGRLGLHRGEHGWRFDGDGDVKHAHASARSPAGETSPASPVAPAVHIGGPSLAPSSLVELARPGHLPRPQTTPTEVVEPPDAGARLVRARRGPGPRYPGSAARAERRLARNFHPLEPPARLQLGPEVANQIQALLRELHVWLLAGYAADAVLRAAAVVEIALRVLASMRPDAGAELGELIDELRRGGRTELLTDASWLYQIRITMEPFIGQIRTDHDADGRRASEIAIRFAVAARLITADEATAAESSATWQASVPASSALLRLDRATHRKVFDDLLAQPPRVLVVVVHGEVGQGHDHFAEIMTWRLRSVASGRWREVVVTWPRPSPSLGIRLAMLLDELAHGLGVTLSAPAADPSTPDGARAWAPALARITAAIDASRDRLLLRHVVRWLGTGAGGDDALVGAYVRAIWAGIAMRSGERVVVGFDLRRIERGGFPLTHAWRIARAELAAARAIEQILEKYHMPHGGVCIALPELISVPIPDLVDWLRAEGGRDRDAARAEASQLVSSTRGGRFDLVVQRLTALALDRHRNPR